MRQRFFFHVVPAAARYRAALRLQKDFLKATMSDINSKRLEAQSDHFCTFPRAF